MLSREGCRETYLGLAHPNKILLAINVNLCNVRRTAAIHNQAGVKTRRDRAIMEYFTTQSFIEFAN